jgi:hypothetical protein
LAQRSSRKKRKARQRARPAAPPAGEAGADLQRGYSRSREKDEAARAALKPLAPGERPRAVTVAGVVALALGLANLVSYLAGVEIRGERPAFVGIVLFCGVMFAAAWGCFRVRYWAVLGMQALLGLAIVIFSLLVVRAESLVAVLIAAAVIGSAGTLFWFLIKSMARIQMPERPGAR